MPFIVLLPGALTISNAGFKSSYIVTSVALLGPLLVTLIVNFTKSPTFTVPVTFDDLTTVRLTFGLTVMLVVFDGTSVVFSRQFTTAKLDSVPLVRTLTVIHTVTEVPFAILSIVQITF